MQEVMDMRPIERRMAVAVATMARTQLVELADEYPYAESYEREELQAGIEFERWMLECCVIALRPPKMPPEGRW